MKQRKKRTKKGEPQHITKAVTHIRLTQANPGKLAALDQLAPVFLSLCQQYVTLFCTKARAMNAYIRASNLAHVLKQIEWNAAKRGVQANRVKSAYSSQECSQCHYPDLANRPTQQTFCCVVCGFQTHADINAASNLARLVGDTALQACKDRQAVKSLLMQRHARWRKQYGWTTSNRPPSSFVNWCRSTLEVWAMLELSRFLATRDDIESQAPR